MGVLQNSFQPVGHPRFCLVAEGLDLFVTGTAIHAQLFIERCFTWHADLTEMGGYLAVN